jgi:hypothetical protein
MAAMQSVESFMQEFFAEKTKMNRACGSFRSNGSTDPGEREWDSTGKR